LDAAGDNQGKKDEEGDADAAEELFKVEFFH